MKSFKTLIFLLLVLSFKQVKSQSDTLTVYPNIFTDTLNIQVYLASSDTVTILIYNSLGQNIKTIASDSVMATGNHTMIYVAPNLPAGFYFVEFKVGEQTTAVKRVVKPSATNSIKTITANANSIRVFPNPNNGNVTLQSPNELGLITICNNLSEVVFEQAIRVNSIQIDLSQQAAGVYLVKAQNQIIKLIKN